MAYLYVYSMLIDKRFKFKIRFLFPGIDSDFDKIDILILGGLGSNQRKRIHKHTHAQLD